MNQALYAHMNNKRKRKKNPPDLSLPHSWNDRYGTVPNLPHNCVAFFFFGTGV
jgi:hypothetical protein